MASVTEIGAPPREQRGVLLAALSAAVFGVGTTFTRLAYGGGAAPLTVVLIRTIAFVSIVGLGLLVLRRDLGLSRGGFLATLWMAGTLIAVSLGYQGSVAFISVSLAALIFYTFPLIVAVVAVAARRDRLTARKTVAVLTAFAGLALALGPGFASLDLRGMALAVLAAVGMALTLTFGGAATRDRDAVVMSFYTNIWMLIVLALAAIATGFFHLPTTPIGTFGTVGLSSSYVIAYVLWYLALSLVHPVRLGALLNIEPLVTLATAWIVLGERLSATQLVGSALVLAAITMIALPGKAPEDVAG